MAIIDGNPPFSSWQFRPTKLQAYQALQTMNRCFEATLLSLERLEHLGLFRTKYLNAYRATLEYTRAQANDELMSTLRDFEQRETARLERMQDEWDSQNRDPDDVLLHARERRQEIKEQIRRLQRALKNKPLAIGR
jgi:hypothetical protein